MARSARSTTARRIRVQVVTAADGGRFRLTRVGAGLGTPAVLIPGMFDNRRCYLRPGGGFAAALADTGFDVWIVERRGTGGVATAPGARAGWSETVRFDLPAAQRIIAQTAPGPACWIAHSFGGVALMRAVATTLRATPPACLVLFNSAADIPLLANRVIARWTCAPRWRGTFPSRLLRLGPEDEPVAALQDAIAWGAADRDRTLFTEHAVTGDNAVPVLALAGPRDIVAPPGRCARFAAALGGSEHRVQLLARRNGFRRDHTHDSALLAPDATRDVFPFVIDWISSHVAQHLPEPRSTHSVSRRLRMHYTGTLPASPERVFEILTREWAALWPATQRRVRDGCGDRDGLSAVRAQRVAGLWPIREEIVTHQPPRLIEYRTVRGPIRGHHGRIELTAVRGGTELDYRIWFDTAFPLPSALLARALELIWRRWSLPALIARCERAGGTR
ncbi:alpha/beta fold hydrolase [Nocardia brasiliensis]|uniref:alpha/beta fold hydrolase n=1 Tax=Nocardia brasiliensis TaxID=37326 RepID=UPI0002E86AF0|nr:alpha/beta fold hydrolase [Nocardia brasiliensis]